MQYADVLAMSGCVHLQLLAKLEHEDCVKFAWLQLTAAGINAKRYHRVWANWC